MPETKRTRWPWKSRQAESKATSAAGAADFARSTIPDAHTDSWWGRVGTLTCLHDILTMPPAPAQGLEQRDRVRITVGLRNNERDPRLLIGALRIEQRKISNGARLEPFLRDL